MVTEEFIAWYAFLLAFLTWVMIVLVATDINKQIDQIIAEIKKLRRITDAGNT